MRFVIKINYIIYLAAKVGGLGYDRAKLFEIAVWSLFVATSYNCCSESIGRDELIKGEKPEYVKGMVVWFLAFLLINAAT